jgi:hypothetical protein
MQEKRERIVEQNFSGFSQQWLDIATFAARGP